MRVPLIAGNWKMNKTPEESEVFVKEFLDLWKQDNQIEVLLCPPYTSLYLMKNLLKETSVYLGAQDVHWEEKGAFTGKISCNMLIDCGCSYVIIGHSEQRTYFYETNETVNRKVKKSLEKGLTPIVCVGETLEQREKGLEKEIVREQLQKAFYGIKDIKNTVIAYEPVWAIGTGKNATPEQAQEMHHFIRDILKEIDNARSQSLRVIYGGSLKPENAKDIFSQPDIDGGLVGGASLKPDSFTEIIKAMSEVIKKI